jgi:SNF2 family DNA or RNA helicase
MRTSYDIRVEELDETYPYGEQPQQCKLSLRPHQLTLLHRCKQFENERIPLLSFKSLRESQGHLRESDYMRTQVGIIGDKVGSGKSFIVLSLIVDNDISNLENNIKTYGDNKFVLSFCERNRSIKTNLLVIPHNLSQQWEQYIKDFSDSLKYMIIAKQKNCDELFQEESNVQEYDLIVVTSTFYNRVAHFLTSRSFKMQRIIYDEVDNMNIPSCVHVDSNFYWFVTASFMNLLWPKGYNVYEQSLNKTVWYAMGIRNAGFVKSLFMDLYMNLSKDFVKILVLKNKESFIEHSISLPPIHNHMIRCKTPIAINILDGFVDREVIESLNAGDISTALSRISPQHRNTEENLVSILIEKLSMELRNCELRLDLTNSLEYANPQEKEAEIARITRKRDDLRRRIDAIKERIANSNTCCICYDDITNKSIAPCCSNAYCLLCISIWLTRNAKCPLCKTTLTAKDLFVVDDNVTIAEPISEDDVNEQFDKLKNLEIILKKRGEKSKFLIFSSYDLSLANVTEILDKLNIKYSYLKGNGCHIRNTVERYKEGDVDVLLINARNYGSGLNLENTTDVVMFHKFESETEKQVIGRAQRYGRSEPLKVWYLLYENEYNRQH